MDRLTHLGRSNPLWRRVQRHAQMSVIFGAPPAASTTATAVPRQIALPVEADELTELPVNDAPLTPISTPTPEKTMSPMTRPALASAPPIPAAKLPTDSPAATDSENALGWRRLQTIYNRHQQKQPPAGPATPDKTPAAIQRQPASKSPPVLPQPDDSDASGTAGSTGPQAPVRPALPRQPLPLEAVWPVQKANMLAKPAPAQLAPEPKNVTLPPQTPITDEVARQVGGQLHQVAPGRATDSPIELIMPTRPRPQRIQRQEDTGSGPKVSLPEQQVVKQGTTATAVPRTEPQMIPTDIGPLPADLWETLGEKPPQPVQRTEKFLESPAAASALAEERESQKTYDAETAVAPPLPEIPMSSLTPKPAKPNIIMTKPASLTANWPLPDPSTPETPALSEVEVAVATPAKERESQSLSEAETTNTPLKMSPTLAKPAIMMAKPLPPTTKRQPSSSPATETAVLTKPTIISPIDTSQPANPMTPQLSEQWPETEALPFPVMRKSAPPSTNQPVQRTAVTRETAVQQAITQAESSPQPIQRQPEIPLLDTAVATLPPMNQPEMLTDMGTMLEAEEKPEDKTSDTAADFDVDELSRRVYQALKRKLVVEWERGYGR